MNFFDASLLTQLSEISAQFFDHILDPNKRLFWGYLVTTVLLVFLFSFQQSKAGNSWHWKEAFGFKVLGHASSKLDLKIWLINIVLKTLLIAPVIVSVANIAISVNSTLMNLLSNEITGQLPTFILFVQDTFSQEATLLSLTLLLFVLDDFSRFLLHWLMHKIPFLWAFHRLHHSAEVLTPMTVYRTHPVESLLYATRLALVNGIVLGVAVFLFNNQIGFLEVLGANVFVFAFNLLGSNLRHSHVRLSFGKSLERWFVSPAQHQIHHSDAAEHRDKNFGTALAIWDRMFGTLLINRQVNQEIKFGTDGKIKTLRQAYLEPFKRSVVSFKFR